ncbi:glycosyltransferase family 39 protein [Butyrivibrio sp. NC3005]|uniref:glycosyltransferase family 39 protein n=1 Tax=Butyrivibrio sp. NC3005 TaxID=1280685 RepID=UPI0003FC1F88|nr:glycosyltransferase family 39 protein [Butyrivibrio sp. NC3005]
MKSQLKNVEITRLVGIMLLWTIFNIVIVPTICMFFGLSINRFSLVIVFICEVIEAIIAQKNMHLDLKKLIISGAWVLFIFTVSVSLSTCVFDMSWDGNSYHKTCTGLLKYGWNPIYETFEEANNRLGFLIGKADKWPIFYTHYPKATWIFGAVVYAFTGNIESGKCYTMLAMIAAVLLVYDFVKKYLNKSFLSLIFAVLSVCNPITLAQAQSYYNDAFMYCMIIVVVLNLVKIIESKSSNNISWIMVGVSVALMINSKFSGVIFAAIYCCGFLAADIFINHLDLRKIVGILEKYICVGILTFGIVGSTTYWHNTFVHRNPFYSITGTDGISDGVLHTNVTQWFGSLPHPLQTLFSLFSKCQNTIEVEPVLKVPFTFSLAEISQSASFVDTRVAGWGIMFSGIFLVSLLYLVFMVYKNRNNRIYIIIGILSLLTLIQIVVVPGLSAARYYLHLYFIPMGALFSWMFQYVNMQGVRKRDRIISFIVIGLLVINCAGTLYADVWRYKKSSQAYSELSNMEKMSDSRKVKICLQAPGGFHGYIFNVLDTGIKDYEIVNEPDSEAKLILAESTCGLYYWYE